MKWRVAVLLALPVAVGSSLFAGCRARSVAQNNRAEPKFVVTPLAQQLRELDSIQALLHKGPDQAGLLDASSARTKSSGWPRQQRQVVDESAQPDSEGGRIRSSFGSSSRYALLRDSILQPVPVPAPVAPAPVSLPVEALTPLWAIAPLAGATFVTQATVTAAVVPEPDAPTLLATGIALLLPLAFFRRRAARRSGSGTG